MKDLLDFAVESNMIEGIDGVTKEEGLALQRFVNLPSFTIDDVIAYVSDVQPNAKLRDNIGVPDVRVGDYYPPKSSPEIRLRLNDIIDDVQSLKVSPFTLHCRYESLHPFTDGNGRSGRAIWMWHMNRIYGERFMVRSFLHWFYYQTLAGTSR